MAFETRAEMDCIIQYMGDKFPASTYTYNWAIGLASSFRYKGATYSNLTDSLEEPNMLSLVENVNLLQVFTIGIPMTPT